MMGDVYTIMQNSGFWTSLPRFSRNQLCACPRICEDCAMARVAAGMGAAAGLTTRAASVPLLCSTSSRLRTLAPAALYGLNFTLTRPAGVAFRAPRSRRGFAIVATATDLESSIKETVSKQPVVVYSKTYCPYCTRVKRLLGGLGYDFELVELDEGGAPGLQDALERVSGQYTVPNVFIGGKHIGGCDDSLALHSRGELEKLLEAAGAHKK